MSQFRRPVGFGNFSVFTPVIKTILIINVTVFLCQNFIFTVFRVGGNSLSDLFFYYCALYPVGENSNFYVWQLITYQFMHGGFLHIFFNLFALWMFGIELEQMWGSRKFLIFYLLCGIGAGLTQLFISPMFSMPAPTIGASGAIYGVLLAFGLTFPDRPIFMFPIFIPIPAKFFVLIYAGLELFMGFSSTAGGVAHFAHLGGAATGFILLKFGDRLKIYSFFNMLFQSKKTPNIYEQQPIGTKAKIFQSNWRSKPSVSSVEQKSTGSRMYVNDEEITQAKVDEILDKITESGYQNLTEREKLILYKLSQKLK
jgi:membrane associated rhomboid family serine protease